MAREMKDSGITWIGKIPAAWDIKKGKWILSRLERPVHEDDGVITCFRDGEVTLRSNRREDGFTISFQETGYQGINIGDLVVHGMDGFAGAIGISDSRGKGTPVLNVLDSTQNKRYIMYYLRSMAYNGVFLALATGIRVRSCDTNWNKLKELPYPKPDLCEQANIASFLDRKCEEIDLVVTDTQRTIAEYKKLKHSIIIEAVTKGVRGRRPVKDSGIEWIGEISSDFEIKKLKYLCYILDQYRSPITADKRNQDAEVLYDYYGASGAIDKIDGYTIDDHVMLIGEDGANLRMRNLPLMYEVNGKAWINNHAHILKPKKDVDFYFLFYALECLDLNTYITGSAQPKLSQDNLRNIWVPIPPYEEQLEIAQYIKEKCAALDKLITSKQQLLSELESYKKTVIYEYVTGKKEVPACQ